MNWLMIGYGVLGGIGYSFSGFMNKDKRESFDWKKMGSTIILSAVIGGVAGLTVVVEKVWKAVWKKIIKK